MNKKLTVFKSKIEVLSTKQISEITGIKINMAYKYKRFENYPSIENAVLLEDAFNIPARAWVDLKKYKDSNKS